MHSFSDQIAIRRLTRRADRFYTRSHHFSDDAPVQRRDFLAAMGTALVSARSRHQQTVKIGYAAITWAGTTFKPSTISHRSATAAFSCDRMCSRSSATGRPSCARYSRSGG